MLHIYSPASKASREVENLTEIKNLQTPAYGSTKFVSLSVINFDPHYPWTVKSEWAKKIHLYLIIDKRFNSKI